MVDVLSFDSSTPGLALAAHAEGSRDGPVVVLWPGGGQTRHAWDEAVTAFAAEGYRAITVDLRGHGESGWASDGDYTRDRMADDVRAVVAQLVDAHGHDPVLVGASLGGMACLVAAGEPPVVPCAGLVLVDVTPRVEPEGVERIGNFMRARPDGFGSVEEAADAVAEYLPHRPRPENLDGLAANLRRGEDGRYYWHWDPEFIFGQHRARAEQERKDRLETAGRNLTVPTMLVRGRLSDVVSDRSVEEFLEAVAHAEYVNVEEAGHMVAGDSNDRFTASVLDFLRRHASVGSGSR